MRRSFLLAATLCLAGHGAPLSAEEPKPWGDLGDGTYANPVLPGDYSDLDAIKVGDDFYAISSTFQFSPGVVILHSRDLVNWQIAGHAVPDLTQITPDLNWDRMARYGRGIWAGAIRYHDDRFWIYFGTPDEGYFMTTARKVEGPWEPLTHFLKESGWDDCCPFWDDDGQGYLVGSRFAKDPVTGVKYNIHLWKMTPDGRGILPESDRILYQAAGSEANKLYKINGCYYHYFSEVREGRVAMMRRATSLDGPWETRQLNHAKPVDPNQGGFLCLDDGSWWFFTHFGTGNWKGREANLLPVEWVDGWPVIGEPDKEGIGNMVWRAKKPLPGGTPTRPQTDDEFGAPELGPQWEWNYQPRPGKWSLVERPGFLRLHAFPSLGGDDLKKVRNTLTQRSMGGADSCATICAAIDGMTDGQRAGLCHFAKTSSMFGVEQTGTTRRIFLADNGVTTTGPDIPGKKIWLRSRWGTDGMSQYGYSLDGTTFVDFGAGYQLTWGSYRGDRIGIFTYNNRGESGQFDVDWFKYDYRHPGVR